MDELAHCRGLPAPIAELRDPLRRCSGMRRISPRRPSSSSCFISGLQPGASTPNCLAYCGVQSLPALELHRSGPTMRPIGSPAESGRGRRSRCASQPRPTEMKRRSMLCQSVRRVPPAVRLELPPNVVVAPVVLEQLRRLGSLTVVSETCGVGVPTVESFTGPPVARLRSASNGAHSRSCAGSVSASPDFLRRMAQLPRREAASRSPLPYGPRRRRAAPGEYVFTAAHRFFPFPWSRGLAPCGRGAVRERRRAPTSSGGTEPARRRSPSVALA